MAFAVKLDVVLIYKNSKRSNAKIRMKVYRHKAIDEILDATNKRLHIPENAEILQIGFGSTFKERYKEKYKL
jgi:CRISPR/Cas system CSM-associated protein Csm5 (group 7 of RAMP superfamily)